MTMHFDTIALHGGEPLPTAGQPVSPSIVTATSFYTTPDTGFSASDLAIAPDPFYTRWGNPAVAILEQRLASLEGAAPDRLSLQAEWPQRPRCSLPD
jgi:O-acetylhomoserine/O-acetylserine sulfhydrylase-like pyridoxal-dependent enzyme